MAVFKINKTSNYTVMSNHHLQEKEMSLKAKGLLSVMLSLPENWDYSISGLVAICKESETAINSTLKELKELGYLKVGKKMPNETNSGRIEYIYNIYEIPQKQGVEKQALEKQGVDFLGLEFLGVENQGQLNTNNTITKELNTKDKKKESKTTTFDGIINSFTDDLEIRELLGEWLKVRKAKRSAMTNRAIELNLQKLPSLAEKSGLSIAEYLKEIICRGWQAFYEINNYTQTKTVNSGAGKSDKQNNKNPAVIRQREYPKEVLDNVFQNIDDWI